VCVRGTFFVILALGVVSAAGQGRRVSGFFRVAGGPDFGYYRVSECGQLSWGGGVRFNWPLAAALGAEVAASANYFKEPGFYGIPENFAPDRRWQVPATAALTLGGEVWRVGYYVVAGGGLLFELNQFDIAWNPELGTRSTVHPLATWGAGVNFAVRENVAVELSPRYVHLAGNQLRYWDMNDGLYYRDGHPDAVELTLAVAFSY